MSRETYVVVVHRLNANQMLLLKEISGIRDRWFNWRAEALIGFREALRVPSLHRQDTEYQHSIHSARESIEWGYAALRYCTIDIPKFLVIY
jgi:hypothetical protein